MLEQPVSARRGADITIQVLSFFRSMLLQRHVYHSRPHVAGILFSTNARAVLTCAEVCPYLSLPHTPGGECLIGSLATLYERLTSEDPVGIRGFRGKGYREASANLPSLPAVPHPPRPLNCAIDHRL